MKNTTRSIIRENRAAATLVLEKSLQGLGSLGRINHEKDIPVLSFDEINREHNKGLSKEEIQAWVLYKRQTGNPMKGWDAYYTEDTEKNKIALLKKGAMYYINGVYVPYPVYAYGNMYDRIQQLEKDKDTIVSLFGYPVYEAHAKVIQQAKPAMLSFMNPDPKYRPKVLAISTFAKDAGVFSIGEFRDEYNTTFDSHVSLQDAFEKYLDYIAGNKKSELENMSRYEIINYYIRGGSLSRRYSDSDKERITVYGPEVAEKLFARMLHEALTLDDQQKLDIIWNRLYNGWSNIPYTRVPIGFECSSRFRNGRFVFTPIQKEQIAFSEVAGSSICAYDVGVGKTIAAIISMANTLYQGKCLRPMIVVPNAVYKKWKKEIFGYEDKSGEFIPGVLSNTGITCNDWYNLGVNVLSRLQKEGSVKNENDGLMFNRVPAKSITMITYKGFMKIGFGQQTMENMFQELSEILMQANDDGRSSKRDLAQQQAKYEELIGISNKNSIVDIEQIGTDYVVIDEAHNFKNVFAYVPTDDDGNKRFKIESAQSNQAIKAFFITNYIQKKYRANVMGLTATPFTNNPIEIYSILSMVALERLEQYGVKNLYSFMENFINQSYEWVNSYDGTLQRKPVVRSFNNKLLLQKILYNHINYKTGEEAGVRRPCKINLPMVYRRDNEKGVVVRLPKDEQKVTYISMNDQQRENQDYVNALANSGYNAAEKMANVMRALALSLDNALSPYIFAKQMPATAEEFVENSPKIKFVCDCIKSVKDYHEAKNEPVSGQVVYSNRGKEYFRFIKEYLEETCLYKRNIVYDGSRVDEVEIIVSGTSPSDREKIKEAFLAGVCRVIIGTATIREGVDLQRKGTVLYNMYPDWNPTDAKQLEGRIWRQGNEFGYVRIVMPLIQDSMDLFVYQKLSEKTSRISDIWFKADRANVIDNGEGIDPEEVKFALYTNLGELARIVIEKESIQISRELEGVQENMKSIRDLKNTVRAIDEYRKSVVQELMQAKINLRSFDDIMQMNTWAWEDYSEQQIADYKTRAAEYANEIDEVLVSVPLTDKSIIGIVNRLKQSIFKLKSVVKISEYGFERYREAFAVIAKAEKTVFVEKGYSTDTDFDEILRDFEGKVAELTQKRQMLNSQEHKDEVMHEIYLKKQANKVEGYPPEIATKDFKSMNHLLDFHFNDVDIETCEIPYPKELPQRASGPDKKRRMLRLKLKAKAIKIKLLLNN